VMHQQQQVGGNQEQSEPGHSKKGILWPADVNSGGCELATW
jgi:hypothetical protein